MFFKFVFFVAGIASEFCGTFIIFVKTMASNKRCRSPNSLKTSELPLAKKGDEKTSAPRILLHISNISQFQELIRIISAVSNTAEFSVSAGFLHIKLMSSANISCCHAQFACDTPGVTDADTHGPFFVDLVCFELCLSTKIYAKLCNIQETILELVIVPNEKITIAIVMESGVQLPYVFRHKLRLLEWVAMDVSMASLKYNFTVRFSIADLKAVLDQFRQFKFPFVEIQIYTDEKEERFALRISATNVRNSSKHTFYCSKQPDSDMVFASSVFSGSEVDRQEFTGTMMLKLSQSFYASHLFKVIKPMNDHYVRCCFSPQLPVCVLYELTTKSKIQYFLCELADDMDAEAVANMPTAPEDFE